MILTLMQFKKTILYAMIAAILPLTVMSAIAENTSAASETGFKGSGTALDPYLISSADDLQRLSVSFVKGAHYRQTCDIIFDDGNIQGHRVFVDLFIKNDKVVVSLSMNVNRTEDAFASVWLNDSVAETHWDDGFADVQFSTDILKDKNTLVAAGSVDGNGFAIAVTFADIGKGISASAPFKGNFMPIGTDERPFSGFYDGNGYSIIGIKIVSAGPEDAAVGLFAYADIATVYNINISSAPGRESYVINAIYDRDTPDDIGTSLALRSSTGSIIGQGTDRTKIISCRNDATVFSCLLYEKDSRQYVSEMTYAFTSVNIASYTGGLAGLGVGVVHDSENAGSVISDISVSVYSLTDVNKVTGSGNMYKMDLSVCSFVGGIVGHSDDIILSASGNTGDVVAVSGISVETVYQNYKSFDPSLNFIERFAVAAGGVAGSLKGGSVADVYNAGHVYSSFAISCVTPKKETDHFPDRDAISLTFDVSSGGIIGLMSEKVAVNRAHNVGDITLTGGAFGYEKKENAAAVLKATGESYAGEIVGMIKGTAGIKDCYYLERAQNHAAAGNQGGQHAVKLKGSKMSLPEMFVNWDFGKVWTISEEGYPKIWIRYDMMIIDMTSAFTGNAKYSVDREHSFESDGTLRSYTDKKGFAITLNDDYSGSQVTVHTMLGDDVITLEQDDSGNYIIPAMSLLNGPPLTLYIDGLKMNPVPPPPVIPAEPLFIFIFAFIGFAIIVTVYNVRSTNSILRMYARTKMQEDE